MLATRKRIARHRARRARKARYPQSQTGEAAPSHPQPLKLPLPRPKLAHDTSFYENQTLEESRAYVQERLTCILGPERMKF
jgi:hypothetical protein